MCGILGLATSRDRRLSLDAHALGARLGLLAHRGPDAEGIHHAGSVALLHRRLALVDPAGGAQPFVLEEPGLPKVVLAWNGELYRHEALRAALARDGARFRTRSDTEALAQVLARRGAAGLAGLRGMFAIAAWFPESGRLLLARDPLGVIPFFHARIAVAGGHEIAFASEPKAILAHPSFRAEPDWPVVASYLETPRRTFGARTPYRGLHALEPGELLEIDLARAELPARRGTIRPSPGAPGALDAFDASVDADELLDASLDPPLDADRARALVRERVLDSIDAHLHADAPIACLLSGGIDSTIIVQAARLSGHAPATFAAGDRDDLARPSSDLLAAREVARAVGSDHHEVLLDEARFVARWDELVGHGFLPLATPNEIAISLLADAIAPHAKAALSGEGADEMFGGYGAPLEASLAWCRSRARDARDATPADATRFHRDAFAWSPRGVVPELLAAPVAEAARAGGDPLEDFLHRAYAEAGDPTSLDAHLEVQRRVNLTNLLERLNLALMHGSVEGRVPFADREILALARRIGSGHLLAGASGSGRGSGGSATGATRTSAIAAASADTAIVTKRVLREAFADLVPPAILARPKASFPLPFETWIASRAGWIDGPVAREVLSPALRELVRTDAARHWRLAWPALNLARWLDVAFG